MGENSEMPIDTRHNRFARKPQQPRARHAGTARQAESRSLVSALLLLLPLAFLWVSCDALVPSRSPGERVYRKRCASCHGVQGSGQTIGYMGNPEANLIDTYWRYGGDASSIEHTLRTELVFEHPNFDELSSEEFRQVAKHVVQLGSKKR